MSKKSCIRKTSQTVSQLPKANTNVLRVRRLSALACASRSNGNENRHAAVKIGRDKSSARAGKTNLCDSR